MKGTPAKIAERYTQILREQASNADRIFLESVRQHAEHYARVARGDFDPPSSRDRGDAPQHTQQHAPQHAPQHAGGREGRDNSRYPRGRVAQEADSYAPEPSFSEDSVPSISEESMDSVALDAPVESLGDSMGDSMVDLSSDSDFESPPPDQFGSFVSALNQRTENEGQSHAPTDASERSSRRPVRRYQRKRDDTNPQTSTAPGFVTRRAPFRPKSTARTVANPKPNDESSD